MHLAWRPHLAGMSTIFRLNFAFPTIYRDLQTWESQPHPQTASVSPSCPISLSLPSLGAPAINPQPPPPASHSQDVVGHGLASFA